MTPAVGDPTEDIDQHDGTSGVIDKSGVLAVNDTGSTDLIIGLNVAGEASPLVVTFLAFQRRKQHTGDRDQEKCVTNQTFR